MSDKQLVSLDQAAQWLLAGQQAVPDTLSLGLDGCRLQVRSNSQALLDRLSIYFGHLSGGDGDADIEVMAIETSAPDLPLTFIDWQREPGKVGRKDSYAELAGARMLRKVRTGMVFLQSQSLRIAAGPCLRNDNQVINFINAQYMTWLQNRGWVICHAAGATRNGVCLGMAGLSGGGKSTLMLNLMDRDGVGFVSNDRLFVRAGPEGVEAMGIPKLPRINPGTIVHNPRLQGLIPSPRREQLLALPAEQLWQMEEKYDVMIESIYGQGRITPHASLRDFVVLNWQLHSDQPMQVRQAELAERPDLHAAILKSPGPFFQYADGHFQDDRQPPDAAASLAALEGVSVWEVSGRVDFAALTRYCHQHWL